MIDLVAAEDPVAAFLAAHHRGHRVALPTSGTTGQPRRIVRTTGSWVSSFDHLTGRTGLDARSRLWLPGPLSATMNLFAAVHAAWVGASVASVSDGATHAQLTPTALLRALDDGVRLHGMGIVVAGDRLDDSLRVRAETTGARITHYYGAAELSFVAWGTCADDLQVFPDVEVAIRDDEIWVRSPYVSLGYLDEPGLLRTSDDGFVTVGDHGSFDGVHLRVGGRGFAAVTTGGVTVPVDEVERTLRTAARGEVVVLGVPHPTLGQLVAAVLTDADDLPLLRETARSDLTPAARPRIWYHLTPLPETAAGKVDRRAVAARVSSADRGVRRLT